MDSMRGRGRGGRRGRGVGRGGGRGAARRKKSIDIKDENVLLPNEEEPLAEHLMENQIPKLDMEADISQLEAPTFTTLSRGPPEAMLRLPWGHPVNLLGEKVLNPMIHCCDQCLHPVLIYGRMIPCKHVFCLTCAKRESEVCPRCNEKVARVEQTGLGTVFMCSHGGTRYGNTGCRRTYLSQRDLQAHINHRHVASAVSDNLGGSFAVHGSKVAVGDMARSKPLADTRGASAPPAQPLQAVQSGQAVPAVSPFYDNHKKLYEESEGISYASPRGGADQVQAGAGPVQPPPRPIPPLRAPGNLITVPIQEPQDPYYPSYNTGYSYPPPAYQDYPPQTDTSVPPPQPWGNPQFYG